MDPSPSQLDAIIQGLSILQQTRLMRISATMIVLYDHVITFSDEIQLIWVKRWSLGKIIFLIIRYQNIAFVSFEIVAMFNNPSQKLSLPGHAWLQWQFYAAMSVFLWTEVVMQIRIYAMYGASKKILWFMLPLFAVNIFTTGTYIGKVLLNHGLSIQLTPTLSLCAIKGNPSFTFWIPVICFETILFGLALYKGIEHFRDRARVESVMRRGGGAGGGAGGFVRSVIGSVVAGSGSERSYEPGWRGQKAIDVLVRDSVLYYGVIFVVYFLQALFFIFDRPLIQAPAGWAYFIPPVLSARLLFNIRRVFDARTFYSVGTGTAFSMAVYNDPSNVNSSANLSWNVRSRAERSAGGGSGGGRIGRSGSMLGSRGTGTTLVVHFEPTETGTGTQRTLTVSDGGRDYYAHNMDDGGTTGSRYRCSEESRDADYEYDDAEYERNGGEDVDGVRERWISLGWLAAEAARMDRDQDRVLLGPTSVHPPGTTIIPIPQHGTHQQLFEMDNLQTSEHRAGDDRDSDVKRQRLGHSGLSEVDGQGDGDDRSTGSISKRGPEDLEAHGRGGYL